MSEEFKSHILYKTAQEIWKVLSPIFLIIGAIGNCLSIIVLMRKHLRSSSTSLFLIVLAISDVSVLYSGLLRQWILAMFQYDVRLSSLTICKLNLFSVYFFSDLSGWILVAVTFERVFLVWFPHSRSPQRLRNRALIVIFCLLAALLAINCHIFYGVGKNVIINQNHTQLEMCTPKTNKQYETFYYRIWPWIDLTVYCIGPFTLLFIGNVLIISRLLQNRRKLRSQVGPQQSELNTREKKTSSMTALLFALNAVYLITSTPISIYLIKFDGWVDSNDVNGMATSTLLWCIFNILMYANNAFNFVLYFISGKKFRKEVTLLCSRRAKDNGGVTTG